MTDVWLTPEEACAVLGHGWEITHDRTRLSRKNQFGVIVAQRRIFDGTEHIFAQPDKVVFLKGELKA